MRVKLIALLLCLLLLAGCAAEPADTPAPDLPSETTAPEQDAPETSSVFSLPYEPDADFNPYSCMSLTNRTVISLVFEPLFAVTAEFEPSPYLCASYEMSGDAMTHTLTLRENVTFSDGSPLTAADAAASLNAAKGSAYYGQRLRKIESITATASNVITIKTYAPCGTLAQLLNIPVTKSGTAQSASPVGTGPYSLGNAQLARVSWWRDATPAVDAATIPLVEISSISNLRDRFEYGDISLACTDPNIGVRAAYHSDYELWSNNTTIMQYLGFNLNSPAFVYTPVRASITYLIDREQLVADTASGFAAAAVLPAAPQSAVYDQKLADNYAYNPAAFSAAMSASSISDISENDGVLEVFNDSGTQALRGTMIVCGSSEQRVGAAQSVVDMLNGAGYALTLKVLDYSAYLSALQRGEFDLYYGEVRLSPDFDLGAFFEAGGALSYGSLADETMALLCNQMRENAGNAYDLYEKIMERGLICPILFKNYAIYAERGAISNLTPCIDGVFTQPIAETP